MTGLFERAQDVADTKADLLDRINRSWLALQEATAGLTDEEMTRPGPDGGWSIKDHLSHISAWDESAAAMLAGRPRYTALGVSEATYLSGDEDAINDAIYQATHHIPPHDVLEDMQITHRHAVAYIEALSDEELRQPVSHFLSLKQSGGADIPMLHRLKGPTYGHYDEHRPWIEALARYVREQPVVDE